MDRTITAATDLEKGMLFQFVDKDGNPFDNPRYVALGEPREVKNQGCYYIVDVEADPDGGSLEHDPAVNALGELAFDANDKVIVIAKSLQVCLVGGVVQTPPTTNYVIILKAPKRSMKKARRKGRNAGGMLLRREPSFLRDICQPNMTSDME